MGKRPMAFFSTQQRAYSGISQIKKKKKTKKNATITTCLPDEAALDMLPTVLFFICYYLLDIEPDV